MFFQIDDFKLHYEVMGEGKPILILHGWAAHLATMTEVFEPIFNEKIGYKRIYVDLPGMGDSSVHDVFSSSDMILSTLMSFAKEVIDEPFLLAGYSYGGYLARAMVAKSAQVSGLLLLEPMVIPDTDARILPDVEWFYDTEICQQASVRSDKLWRDANSEFLARLRGSYALSFDTTHVKVFNAPTLILLGHQDGTVGFVDQISLLKDYPRTTFAILDLAGHNLQMEQSEVFEFLVKNWLLRIENGV
ncbi:alpha/beta fold hydrolase [Lactococcus allomyrinae]|uniref:Alpha/beta hydrolase n=1 Tax=Lactococcus allomyrinae TaxID=2419773 RepID=A0A387BGU2_9LACT|nr:alpha/beta hydrolase [Lactococcus allomyrinae]AYG00237.1 alpha/beta hydrolase [Lactococcus allomyrinae]